MLIQAPVMSINIAPTVTWQALVAIRNNYTNRGNGYTSACHVNVGAMFIDMTGACSAVFAYCRAPLCDGFCVRVLIHIRTGRHINVRHIYTDRHIYIQTQTHTHTHTHTHTPRARTKSLVIVAAAAACNHKKYINFFLFFKTGKKKSGCFWRFTAWVSSTGLLSCFS
jgi:hypothetical protein